MRVGSVFNIDIQVSMLLVVMVAVAILLGNGTEVATIFFVLLVHEMAHVLMARILQLKVREIELLPFGGAVRIESLFELNPTHEMYIALAGPMANILMFLGYTGLQNMGLVSVQENDVFVRSNLILAGFNLLPALPLDGGRVIRAILSREIGIKKATQVAVYGGMLLALFLTMTGIYALYYRIFNPVFFIMAVFLFYSSLKEKRVATYVFLRDIAYKKDILIKEGSMSVKEIVVLYDLPLREVIKKFVPYRYHYVKVVDEQLRVKGSLSEGQIVKGIMDYGINAPVARLLRRK